MVETSHPTYSTLQTSPLPICQYFTEYDEIKKGFVSNIASKDKGLLRRGIRLVPERREKILASDGQYFE
jgi:hypothetical protein